MLYTKKLIWLSISDTTYAAKLLVIHSLNLIWLLLMCAYANNSTVLPTFCLRKIPVIQPYPNPPLPPGIFTCFIYTNENTSFSNRKCPSCRTIIACWRNRDRESLRLPPLWACWYIHIQKQNRVTRRKIFSTRMSGKELDITRGWFLEIQIWEF